MTGRHRVAVVDDVAAMHKLYDGVLKDRYEVLAFSTGREFVDSGEEVDAVLLDIEMPEMDGYETCRHLRAQGMDATQVLFVSGHDSEQERMAAYEAGGDDFVTKPIVADELRLKVDVAVRRRKVVQSLEDRSSMAQQIAFSAMSSMGALGVILDFMRGSADICDAGTLATRLLEAMHAWGLRGAVRLRGADGVRDAFSDNQHSPLQASVMDSLKDMGRIFQMRSRAIVNFPHVTLLVENLPVDDEDALGRTRDNLAMLGETAETTLRGLNAMAQHDRQQRIARETLDELKSLLASTAEHSTQNRGQTEAQLMHLRADVQMLLRSFGLTSIQESMISGELERSTQEMLDLFDEATQIEMQFAHVLGRLQVMSLPGGD